MKTGIVNHQFLLTGDKVVLGYTWQEIECVEQEESYTSKASSLDGDKMSVWKPDSRPKYTFAGKRIKRGLYRTAKDWLVNADANGALNILRKQTSKLDDFLGEFRGCLAQPVRVKCS